MNNRKKTHKMATNLKKYKSTMRKYSKELKAWKSE